MKCYNIFIQWLILFYLLVLFMLNKLLSKSLLLALLYLPLGVAAEPEQNAGNYQQIEWIALMPEEDLEVLLNPPEYLSTVEDGSTEDSLEAFSQQAKNNQELERYQQALQSTQVMGEWDKKSVRIPGFVVPLQTNEQQLVTEFFIVPYFGACLHMPPPPPNQIIYAKMEQGVEVASLYDPFWFAGKLTIETHQNPMGTAAYRLWIDKVDIYEE